MQNIRRVLILQNWQNGSKVTTIHLDCLPANSYIASPPRHTSLNDLSKYKPDHVSWQKTLTSKLYKTLSTPSGLVSFWNCNLYDPAIWNCHHSQTNQIGLYLHDWLHAAADACLPRDTCSSSETKPNVMLWSLIWPRTQQNALISLGHITRSRTAGAQGEQFLVLVGTSKQISKLTASKCVILPGIYKYSSCFTSLPTFIVSILFNFNRSDR